MVIKNRKCTKASKIAVLFVFTNADESFKKYIIGNSKNKILEPESILDII